MYIPKSLVCSVLDNNGYTQKRFQYWAENYPDLLKTLDEAFHHLDLSSGSDALVNYAYLDHNYLVFAGSEKEPIVLINKDNYPAVEITLIAFKTGVPQKEFFNGLFDRQI